MTLSASVFTFIFLKLLREKYFLKNLGDLGDEDGLKNPWKKEYPGDLLPSLPRDSTNCAHFIGAHLTNTMQLQQLLWATSSSGFTMEKLILLLENRFFLGPLKSNGEQFLSFLFAAVFNLFADA